MPTYEYECPRCSSRFELRRSFSENSPVSCPQCGCEARRIFSPVPIIFKGAGFYSTDRRGDHGHSAPADSTDKVKTDSKEEDKAREEAKTGSTEEHN